MRCETCQGQGHIFINLSVAKVAGEIMRISEADHWQQRDCPQCHGGTAYCCDEAGANPPNSWPIKGSNKELYQPIDIHED